MQFNRTFTLNQRIVGQLYFPFRDLFTQNFAYVGVRSTGFGAGSYLIAGPKWKGKKPAGIKQVFRAETDIWLLASARWSIRLTRRI